MTDAEDRHHRRIGWLLACIADDEAAALLERGDVAVSDMSTVEYMWVRLYRRGGRTTGPRSSSHVRGAPSPQQVMAQCAANRTIVEQFAAVQTDPGVSVAVNHMVRLVASVYARRRGYRADDWSSL